MTLEIALERLHRGWAAMGLFIQSAEPLPSYPEALVVGLATVGRYDQRLFDEALSFLKCHPRILRSNYFKFWSTVLRDEDKACLRLILNFCGINNILPAPSDLITPCPLFLKSGRPPYVGHQVDPLFESQGFLRNPFEISGMVPDLSRAAQINPWIRMRLSSGILAQSDLLVLVVNTPQITAPIVSDLLGITTKSAWTNLQDLVTAQWLTKKTIGRRDFYSPTPSFLNAFSFLVVSSMETAPLLWIEAAIRASWLPPIEQSPDYQRLWLQQKEKELLPLHKIGDRLGLQAVAYST